MAHVPSQVGTLSKFTLTMFLCLGLGIVAVISSSIYSPAHAGGNYAFKVKVQNVTGKKIRVLSVYWQPKGAGKYQWKNCDIDLALNAGKNKTLTCSTRANVKKWKRRIRMSGYCYKSDGTSPRENYRVDFPLTKKWFARDWAVNHKQTYTLVFKRDQFRCD